jgi:hypothetical protein
MRDACRHDYSTTVSSEHRYEVASFIRDVRSEYLIRGVDKATSNLILGPMDGNALWLGFGRRMRISKQRRSIVISIKAN